MTRSPPAASSVARDVLAPWAWHRRALLARRRTLKRERELRLQAIQELTDSAGDDPVDRANGRAEREALLAQLALKNGELVEVEAALKRIDDGTYGVCELTGRPISAERLRAIPWTRFCHEAAENHPPQFSA